jgi:hypothetical protein
MEYPLHRYKRMMGHPMRGWAKAGAAVVVLGVAGYGIFALIPLVEAQLHVGGPQDAQQGVIKSPSGDLNCGSDDAKALAIQLARKRPPAELLATASKNSQDAVFQSCLEKFEQADRTRASCLAAVDPPYSTCFEDPRPTPENSDCVARSNQCTEPMTAARAQNESCRSQVRNDVVARSSYSITNVRLEAKDQTTGAVQCNVTLHLQLPGGPPSFNADEEISYKLEKMEDGGLHIDMAGLH